MATERKSTYEKSPILETQYNEIYVAIYDYKSNSKVDLNFKKNDKISKIVDHGEWFYGKNLFTKEQGFVPTSYVANEHSLNCQPWFFPDINRIDAEYFLLYEPENIIGSYLVRTKNDLQTPYVLSIRYNNLTVKHYKIRKDNLHYYISDEIRCTSIQQLIRIYERDENNSLCLVTRLTKPCIRHLPQTYDLSAEYIHEWELDENDIDTRELMAEGNFATIHKGTWKGKPIAIKKLKNFDKTEFNKEMDVLKKLKHKNVITLYGTCNFQIIFEYMQGNLLDYIKLHKNLPPLQLLYTALQIAIGMEYLEANNVIHRDLAARNVLITDNSVIKISDFGLSRILSGTAIYTMSSMFPVRWSAIECFEKDQCTSKSDIWSYAILLMELYTSGEKPYSNISTQIEVKKSILDGNRMKRPKNVPIKMYSFMLQCWDKNPDKRPTFHDIRVKIENLQNI